MLPSLCVAFISNLVGEKVESRLGAVQVFRKGYIEADEPLKFALPTDPQLVARIARVSGVAAVAPRLEFDGLLANGAEATLFQATAIDPGINRGGLEQRRLGAIGEQAIELQPRRHRRHAGDPGDARNQLGIRGQGKLQRLICFNVTLAKDLDRAEPGLYFLPDQVRDEGHAQARQHDDGQGARGDRQGDDRGPPLVARQARRMSLILHRRQRLNRPHPACPYRRPQRRCGCAPCRQE